MLLKYSTQSQFLFAMQSFYRLEKCDLEDNRENVLFLLQLRVTLQPHGILDLAMHIDFKLVGMLILVCCIW